MTPVADSKGTKNITGIGWGLLTTLLQLTFWPVVFLSWLPLISSDLFLLGGIFWAPESELNSFLQSFPYFDKNVAMVLLGIGVIGAIALTRLAHVVALAPLVAAILIYSRVGGSINPTTPIEIGGVLNAVTIFGGSVLLSMIYFCRRGHITDSFFLPFYVFAFIDCLMAYFGSGFTFFGVILSRYWPSMIGIMLSIMLIFFVRSLILVVEQNQDIRRKYRRLLRPAALQAFLLWWPMLLFFAIVTGIYHYAQTSYVTPCLVAYLQNYDAIENAKKANESDQNAPLIENKCVPEKTVEIVPLIGVQAPTAVEPAAPGAAAPPAPVAAVPPAAPVVEKREPTIDEALVALIDNQAAKIKDAGTTTIDAINVEIAAGTKSVQTDAVPSIRNGLPSRFPGTEQRRCGWLNIGCLLMNGVKSMMNSSYQKFKTRQLDELQADIDGKKAGIDDKSLDAATVLKEEGTKRIDQLAVSSNNIVRQMTTALLLFGWVIGLYSVLVLFKSFLVVFARVIYARRTFTPLEDDDMNEVFGTVTKVGDSFKIEKNSSRKYYVKYDAIGVNVVERKRVPYFYKLPVIRILTGNYILCYIDTEESFQQECDLKVDAPCELVIWELKPGE